jgi:hypothetical protein
MRPAQTGHGIISEGKLEAGMAALWRIRPTNDSSMNYSLLLRRSQEKLCIAHRTLRRGKFPGDNPFTPLWNFEFGLIAAAPL